MMARVLFAKCVLFAFIGLVPSEAGSQKLDAVLERFPLPFPDNVTAHTESTEKDGLGDEVEVQIEIKAALESQCGAQDDSQFVEEYNGQFSDAGFSPTIDFVMNNQPATGQIQWNTDLATQYPPPGDPGTVTGARWCSGTLISEDLFLTAGHCFNRFGGGWKRPSRIINGQVVVIDEDEIAQNMHVNFNYQFKGATKILRDAVEFPIVTLIENWEGGLDYAIVRLGRNADGDLPGTLFGMRNITGTTPVVGTGISVIQHPNGKPKKVEAGRIKLMTATLIHYNDLDTLGGASGSAVLSERGEIIGVHVRGGCTEAGFGSNKATSIEAIRKVSGIIQ